MLRCVIHIRETKVTDGTDKNLPCSNIQTKRGEYVPDISVTGFPLNNVHLWQYIFNDLGLPHAKSPLASVY